MMTRVEAIKLLLLPRTTLTKSFVGVERMWNADKAWRPHTFACILSVQYTYMRRDAIATFYETYNGVPYGPGYRVRITAKQVLSYIRRHYPKAM